MYAYTIYMYTICTHVQRTPYLHLYTPTHTSGDLWEALEQSSGKPVASVMNTWTKQMGFPLLTVQEKQVFYGRGGGGLVHMEIIIIVSFGRTEITEF